MLHTHNSYKHTQKQLQPLFPTQGNGPADQAEHPGFQCLVWIKQSNAEPDLSQPYHTQPQWLGYCHGQRCIRCFLEEEILSWIRKKYSLTVLLRVCCCKHLSFISQQKISLGKGSRTEHGGFIGTTGPTQNNSQELASFLFHLVHSNSVSNYFSFPFIKDVADSVSTSLIETPQAHRMHPLQRASSSKVSQSKTSYFKISKVGWVCVHVCKFCI